MEGYRGRPRRGIVYREVWRVQDRSKRNNRRKGKAHAKKQGERGEALRDIRGVKGRYWNENVFARPNGLREKAETAISCRGPGPTRKKRYTSSREEDDVATNVCPCGTTIESRTHIVGECEICK